MEKVTKPENIVVYRRRTLTAIAACVWILAGAGFAAVMIAAFITMRNTETAKEATACLVFGSIFGAIMFVNGAFCFSNLRYPYIAYTDEKGFYDYSGFIHCGFVAWSDIELVTCGNTVSDLLDAAAGDSPGIRLWLKSAKNSFKNRNKLWKIAYIFSESGCVKVRTLCSKIRKKEFYALIIERFTYYSLKGAEDGTNPKHQL